jgi:hypothetical protein
MLMKPINYNTNYNDEGAFYTLIEPDATSNHFGDSRTAMYNNIDAVISGNTITLPKAQVG